MHMRLLFTQPSLVCQTMQLGTAHTEENVHDLLHIVTFACIQTAGPPTNYGRRESVKLQFCFVLNGLEEDTDYLKRAVFTDEAPFHSSGVVTSTPATYRHKESQRNYPAHQQLQKSMPDVACSLTKLLDPFLLFSLRLLKMLPSTLTCSRSTPSHSWRKKVKWCLSRPSLL